MNKFYVSSNGGSFIIPLSKLYAVECLNPDIRCRLSGEKGFEITVGKNYELERNLIVKFTHPRLNELIVVVNLLAYDNKWILIENGSLNKLIETISSDGGNIIIYANAPGECVDNGGCNVYLYLNTYNITVPKSNYVKEYVLTFNISGTEQYFYINKGSKTPNNPTLNLIYSNSVSSDKTEIEITVKTTNVKSIVVSNLSKNVTCTKTLDDIYKLNFPQNLSSENVIREVTFNAIGLNGGSISKTATITQNKKIETVLKIEKVFYGATNDYPNTQDILLNGNTTTILGNVLNITMKSNNNTYLYTAVPYSTYKLSSWKDDLGMLLIQKFESDKYKSFNILFVKITSELYDLDNEQYIVYVRGNGTNNLGASENISQIYKK